MSIALALVTAISAFADERTLDELALRMKVTDAEAAPLNIEREIELYAPGAAVTEYAIVFSRPLAETSEESDGETGGSSFLDWLRPSEDGDSTGDAWLRKMDAHFRTLIAERTEDGQPEPDRYFNTEEEEYRRVLPRQGFTGLARRRNIVGGERLWAALYGRDTQPDSARLGHATARMTVRFDPQIGEDGRSIRLGPTVEPAIEPGDAPEGVDRKAWEKARAQQMSALRDEARALAARLEAQAVGVPASAGYIFEAGDPYYMTVDLEHDGKAHQIRLSLRGEVAPATENADAGGSSEQALRDELAGGWILRLEHPEHGWLEGFAELKPDGGAYLGVYYPDGYRGDRPGCGYEARADEQRILARCHLLGRVMQMELGPDKRRMRGYWYHGSRYGSMTEETKIGRVQWRRMEPAITEVVVEEIAGGALDYQKIGWPRGSETMNANKPKARLILKGQELPRDSTSRGLEMIALPDPTLNKAGQHGNNDGTEFQVDFWLNHDVRPGRKILVLNGREIEFENYDEALPMLRSLDFVSATEDRTTQGSDRKTAGIAGADAADLAPGGGVPEIRMDGAYVLEARYETASGDLVKYPALRIERNGETVYRFPEPRRRMTRDTPATLYRTERLALADLFGETPDADAGNAIDAIPKKAFGRAPGEGGPYPAAPYAPRQTYLAVPGTDEAGATPVQVTRVSGHPNLYRSPRLVMLAPGHKPPSAGQIEQKTDADIEAEPPVPVRAPAGMRLRVGPAREGAETPTLRSNVIAGIDVIGHPPESLWEKALARAKECRRKEGSETEFTNYILTNLVVPGESVAQSVPIGVEDHVAAILLRDELVQALDEWIEKQNARSPVDPDAPPDERRRQQRMWAAAQRVEAEALIDLASREGEHAFFAMKVTNQHGEPNAIYLGGALHKFDYEKEMLNRKGDWEDFVAYARKAIAEARGEVLGCAARSLERAREPNDCELREVLEVVGVGLDAVVQRLLPKLLRPRNANEPPYPEWVPDGAARAAVNSVHLTAQAVAAQEEYSSIDTDVAIAAATLGLTSAGYGVTLAGERAVAYGAARAAAAANRAAQGVRRALQATEALDVYAAYRDAEDWERAHADRAFGYGIASVAGGERLRQAWENERERRFGLAVNAAAASALPVVQGVGARAAGDDVVRLSTSPHQSPGTSSSPSAQRPSSPDATAGQAGRFPDAVPDNRVLDQSAAPSGASSPPVDPEADTVLNTRPRQGVRAGDTGRMQPPASPPSGEPSNVANVDPEGDIGPGAIEDSTPGIDEDFAVDLRTPEGRARLDARVQAGLDEIERTRQLEDAPDTSPQPPRLPQDLFDWPGFKDLPARPRTGSPEMNEVLEGYKTPQERAADKAFITSETQELPVPPADTGASRKALETDPLPENAGTAHSGVRESRSLATSSRPRAKTEAREVESRPSAAPPSVEEFDPTASETDAATRPGAFAEPEVDEFDPTASSDIDRAAESYARNYANRRATERSRRQQQLAEVLARRERAPTFRPPEGERLRNPNVRWLVAGDAARLQALMRRYNSVQDRVYADTINDYAQQMINDEFECP